MLALQVDLDIVLVPGCVATQTAGVATSPPPTLIIIFVHLCSIQAHQVCTRWRQSKTTKVLQAVLIRYVY